MGNERVTRRCDQLHESNRGCHSADLMPANRAIDIFMRPIVLANGCILDCQRAFLPARNGALRPRLQTQVPFRAAHVEGHFFKTDETVDSDALLAESSAGNTTDAACLLG